TDFRTFPGGTIESLFILQRGPVKPAPAASTPAEPVPVPQPGAVVGVAGAAAGVAGVFAANAPSSTWRVVAAETEGKPVPAEQLRGARVVISGTTMVVSREGQQPMVVRYAVDTR